MLTLKEEQYYEFHAKVPIVFASELETLQEICKEHKAKLSSAVSKTSGARPLEFHVTLRLKAPRMTSETALGLKVKLLEAIKAAHLDTTGKIHQELSVYDTNEKLDEGWE